jgi:hypothetical protein
VGERSEQDGLVHCTNEALCTGPPNAEWRPLRSNPVTSFSPPTEALENVGTMEMVLRKGYTREQFIGVGAGYFMPSEPNQRTKHKRLKTLKELLHGQRSPTPTYAPLIKPAMKNYGTRRRPYMDLKNEGPVEAPELSATREQLNPLSENGFYLIYTDIQHYRAALERWLRQIAPRLYNCKDIN